jgi:hypothetical protein
MATIFNAVYWILKLERRRHYKHWQKITFGGSKGRRPQWIYRRTYDGGLFFVASVIIAASAVDGMLKNVATDSIYGVVWILKLNAQGNILWQKLLEAQLMKQANSIQQTKSIGSVYVCQQGWNRSLKSMAYVRGNHRQLGFLAW